MCYYNNPMTDGFLTQLEGVDEEEYMKRQKGMLTELLRPGCVRPPLSRCASLRCARGRLTPDPARGLE